MDIRQTPDEPQAHVFLGLMRAYTGDSANAMAAAERGLAVADAQADARLSIDNAYYYYVAARAAVVARNHSKAIAWLRESRSRRYFASPAWIRLDPSFAPLRGDPAFEKMLAEAP